MEHAATINCICCIVGHACPMQLNEAVDTGKSVEVQCPIIFVNGGSRCKGMIVLDGQRWGVRGGETYHRIIENYDEDGLGKRGGNNE